MELGIYHNQNAEIMIIAKNNVKSVSLQPQEETIRLHNTQSVSAAVALITKSIQLGAPGS